MRRLDRLRNFLRDVREALGQVVVPAREELHLRAADVRERAVAVPLHLERPLLAVRHVALERRQHRPVPAAGRRRLGRLLALADDQPVLLLAVEVRRDERPHAVQPLAVQPDGETAVSLLLDELVRSLVPDLDRAGAVVPLGDLALEARVLDRVVLDVDGEVLLSGLEGNALRDRPRRERAVALEPEVVVEPPRVVPLDDEDRAAVASVGRLARRTAPASAPGLASAGTAAGSRVESLPEGVFRNRAAWTRI